MRRFRLIAVGLLAVGWIAAAEATEQKRVALVIGNSDYTALTTLNNPASDAGAIGAALRKQGFDVILHHDLDRGEFLDALDEIRAEAIGADVAVVYYAGHGMEVGGVNIVAPVDADIDCETAQARRTVALEQLFAAVSPAKNQIVLLDSCRNDPFPQCKVKGANEGGFRGLDRVSTHDGALLVANATLPGRLAADGPAGKHSPFAAALLDRFAREPGKFLYQNLNDAAGDVRAATNGAQIPEILTRGGLPEICLASKGCDAGGGSSNEAALRDEIDALRQQLASGSQAGPDKAIVVEPGSEADLEAEIEEPKQQVASVDAKAVVGSLPSAGSSATSKTLQEVRARGSLNCGVSVGLIGFSAPDENGNWSGIDADLCRAVAAATLGDADSVKFYPLAARERFTALQSGEIDVLIRNTSWTTSRDNDLGLRFAGTNVYDGLGFMLRGSLGVTSALQLSGAAVCLLGGTTTELDVARYFDTNRMEYSPVVFQTWDEAASAYDDNRCDVLPSDATVLYATRLGLTAPGDHIVLPERLTSEQLGPYVRADDPIWLGVVRSALNALFWAEELGVTAANVGQMRSSDDGAIRRLLGIEGELGESLGLASGWAYAAIEAVGNYGESFERNLGSNSPLKMDRGQNNLVSRGGLITAPVLR